MITFEQLPEITEGKIIYLYQSRPLRHIIFDSRKAIINAESCFLAIDGVNHDGHTFIRELYRRGIRNFIVEKAPDHHGEYTEANFFLVPDSLRALQHIAAFHRDQFEMPVIGITGSNGKTIIKEWLAQVLSKKYHVVKSPQSFNSQLGVPLSVWQMQPDHDIAIFEAGISKPGEMTLLQPIIKPSIGIFTNVGTAHDEYFESREQKAGEKWKLFDEADVVIYCKDHTLVHQTLPAHIKSFTWGNDPGSDIVIRKVEQSGTDILVLVQHGEHDRFIIPFTDQASVENAMHSIALMLYLGMEVNFIQNALRELHNLPMRLAVKEGLNDTLIIDDTYNNDLEGLRAALTFMQNQQHKTRSTLIISDIPQAGKNADQLYGELAALIRQFDIHRLIGIGEKITRHHHFFNQPDARFYADTVTYLMALHEEEFQDEKILIKGARTFQFEKIANRLQKKIHGTVLEINLDALTHNLNFYRSLLRPKVKLMAMVKAFAYGSGNKEVARLLQFHKVDYLAVAYPDEGVELRNNGITLPIMVMNCPPDAFSIMHANRLEPEIINITQLRAYVSHATESGTAGAVHLKLDTGMHRLGFVEDDLDPLIEILISNKARIRVASIFSHLAGADSPDHDAYSRLQVQRFEDYAHRITKKLNHRPLWHILNSPGIVRYPDNQFDMVRLGVGLYGYEACGIHQDKLRYISTLKTVISQVKTINKGETIGYGRKGVAEDDMRIAIIAIGYADGFSRAFSNGKIAVEVNGSLCPVVGNVCMDMTMIDITHVDAREGDEVIVFGSRPTILDLANAIQTIPYEILTNIGERVKRVFVAE